MSRLLKGSINLSKIDKSKQFKYKNGDDGLNIDVWINDTLDNYGNIAAVQQQVLKGENKIYLGNLKDSDKIKPVPNATPMPNINDVPDNLPY